MAEIGYFGDVVTLNFLLAVSVQIWPRGIFLVTLDEYPCTSFSFFSEFESGDRTDPCTVGIGSELGRKRSEMAGRIGNGHERSKKLSMGSM